jgi:tetratricopeptide (TPR) repeat protein
MAVRSGVVAVAALAAAACASESKQMVVPAGMRREATERPRPEPNAVPPAPALSGAMEPPTDKLRATGGDYVLRLAEHNRVWELELPESAGGYEMRIPLAGPLESPSAADAELLATASDKPLEAGKEPRKGYLGTLAKVREMYASHQYEMALVEIVDLEASYPKDARIQAMKGSLYVKLGKPQLARESWEKALALNPQDPVVTEALRSMKEE